MNWYFARVSGILHVLDHIVLKDNDIIVCQWKTREGSMGEAMTFHPSPHTIRFYEGGIVDDSRVLDWLPD
jgi:hypothetical protein